MTLEKRLKISRRVHNHLKLYKQKRKPNVAFFFVSPYAQVFGECVRSFIFIYNIIFYIHNTYKKAESHEGEKEIASRKWEGAGRR